MRLAAFLLLMSVCARVSAAAPVAIQIRISPVVQIPAALQVPMAFGPALTAQTPALSLVAPAVPVVLTPAWRLPLEAAPPVVYEAPVAVDSRDGSWDAGSWISALQAIRKGQGGEPDGNTPDCYTAQMYEDFAVELRRAGLTPVTLNARYYGRSWREQPPQSAVEVLLSQYAHGHTGPLSAVLSKDREARAEFLRVLDKILPRIGRMQALLRAAKEKGIGYRDLLGGIERARLIRFFGDTAVLYAIDAEIDGINAALAARL